MAINHKVCIITCDACGKFWPESVADTAAKARTQLSGTGWRLNIPGNGSATYDYCPEHAV